MRASSAPASLHKVAAWRASGSSCRPADAPSKMPHTSASRSARPAARSRSSVTAAACSSWVRSRHRAWCRAVPVSWATRSRSAAGTKRSWFTLPGSNARAVISSKLANYHGNPAVESPWVVTSRLRQSELATLDLRAWFMLTGRLAGPDRLADLRHAELLRARRRLGPRRLARWFRAGSRHGRRERFEREAAGVQLPSGLRVIVAVAAEQLPVPPGACGISGCPVRSGCSWSLLIQRRWPAAPFCRRARR
jgi:hypothetical protein